jgi:asparagine synthase (glutamine-hydrolysing)
MCGVAGAIHLNGEPVSRAVLQLMTDAIAHRGPDGEGHWIEDNVGIGHRRLSIIDPSPAGHQPMLYSRDRFVLSYNGELYNYKELRKELEGLGNRFNSQTDTEVFLAALAQWGTDALVKFNGMFAFALWDRKHQKLLLARDRYGVKPLYYSRQGKTFAFGSEQKAITAQPGFQRTLNKRALLEYFTFQNIFTDQTLLEDVTLLPAGHFGYLDAKSGSWKTQKYWDYHFQEPDRPVDEREYTEELSRLLAQAVSRQLVSDVELGSYLSGGIDSATITALASKKIPNLKTFTIGFDLSSASGLELAFDERAKAEAISAFFKTEHYEMVLKAGDMERCLPALIHHLEEPRLGQSYPNYYAAKLASKSVKVVLSGAGGDELFGGYPWRYYRATSSSKFEDYVDEYYLYWQRLVSNTELRAMFSPIWDDVKDVWTRDIFSDVFANHENKLETPEDFINHSLYFEAKTFLHGLFVVEDKLSMAHSLETRVPFMDNDLVEFAMSCPVRLKLRRLTDALVKVDENQLSEKAEAASNNRQDGKQLLRSVADSLLPEGVASARKQGFSAPDASWFKGESIDFITAEILASNSPADRLLDKNTIVSIVSQHLSGKKNKRLFIWSILSFLGVLKKYPELEIEVD